MYFRPPVQILVRARAVDARIDAVDDPSVVVWATLQRPRPCLAERAILAGPMAWTTNP